MLNSSDEVDQQCQLNFTIPLASRRTVIGPRGKTIKAIAKHDNVIIKIIRQLRLRWLLRNDVKNCAISYDKFAYFGLPTNYRAYYNDVDVVIRGKRSDCDTAKEEVLQKAEEGTTEVFVAEFEVEDTRKMFIIKETEPLQEKYTELIFHFPHYTDENTIYIKGPKLKVQEALEEIKQVNARIMEDTVVLEVKIPEKTLGLVSRDIPSDLKDDALVKFDEHGVTICGVPENVKAVEAEILKAAPKYTTEVIELPTFIPGDSSHNSLIISMLWLEVLGSKFWGKGEVDFDDLRFEIRGAREDVKAFQKFVIETFEKITPATVTVIPGNFSRIEHYDLSNKLGDIALENNILYYIGEESAYLIDGSIARDEQIDGLDSRLREVMNCFQECSEVLESMERSVLHLGKMQKFLFSMQGGAQETILDEYLKGSRGHLSFNCPTSDEITIEGPPDAVQGATDAIKKMVKDIEENGGYRAHERKVMVPSKILTGLIGRNRQFWRRIKKQNRVHLMILDKGKGTRSQQLVEEDSKTSVVIKGIKLDVDNAAACILSRVEELQGKRSLE